MKYWQIQWVSSTVTFCLVLVLLYLDGLFGDRATGAPFWVMIGIVVLLVSGLSAKYFIEQARKK